MKSYNQRPGLVSGAVTGSVAIKTVAKRKPPDSIANNGFA